MILRYVLISGGISIGKDWQRREPGYGEGHDDVWVCWRTMWRQMVREGSHVYILTSSHWRV